MRVANKTQLVVEGVGRRIHLIDVRGASYTGSHVAPSKRLFYPCRQTSNVPRRWLRGPPRCVSSAASAHTTFITPPSVRTLV